MAASKPTSELFLIANDVSHIEQSLRDFNYGLGCFPFGDGAYPTSPTPCAEFDVFGV